MTLEQYCQQFTRLTRAPNRVFPATTKHRAPHKPLLLLAVMEMVRRGEMINRFISITGELTELNTLFTTYWRRLMPVALW
jgi:putative restriction endonuclease